MTILKLSKTDLIQIVRQNKPALLITTSNMLKRNIQLGNLLGIGKNGCQIDVYDQVREYPSLEAVRSFYATIASNKYQIIYAIGGGSVIDFAKAIKASLEIGCFCESEILNVDALSKVTNVSLISIPTIAGSGAEVTPFAALWDLSNHKKLSLDHSFLSPDYVYYDSTFLHTLPNKKTAISCLDALSHSLDVLWNKKADSLSIKNAIYAFKVLIKVLPVLASSTTYTDIYDDLFTCSFYAGTAIASSRTSMSHGLSYQLTLKYNIPHGAATSLFLPALLRLYCSKISPILVSTKVFANEEELIDYSYVLKSYLSDIFKKFDIARLLLQVRSENISFSDVIDNTRTNNAVFVPTKLQIKEIFDESLIY